MEQILEQEHLTAIFGHNLHQLINLIKILNHLQLKTLTSWQDMLMEMGEEIE